MPTTPAIYGQAEFGDAIFGLLVKSFTEDALFKEEDKSVTFTETAIFVERTPITFTEDVLFKKELSTTFSVDALFEDEIANPFSETALFKEVNKSATFSEDVLLQDEFSITFNEDALFKQEITIALSEDTLFKEIDKSQTFTESALFKQEDKSATFSVDALFKIEQDEDFAVTAIFKGLDIQKTFTVSTIFITPFARQAREDFESILEATDLLGQNVTLIKETKVTDATGRIIDVTETEFPIIVLLEDITQRDRDIFEMGTTVVGDIKAFCKHQYRINATTSVRVLEGDIIKDWRNARWRVEVIVSRKALGEGDPWRTAILRRETGENDGADEAD